jgi:hypothetical protein
MNHLTNEMQLLRQRVLGFLHCLSLRTQILKGKHQDLLWCFQWKVIDIFNLNRCQTRKSVINISQDLKHN